jgi:hypothetical protein
VAAALDTQLALRRVRAAGAAVRATLAAAAGTEATPLTRAAAVLDALVVSLGALGDVRTLHFHPGRVSERVNARRLRDRCLNRAVDHLVAFATAGGPAPHEATPRRGSAVVGDWAAHKASAGAFRKKPFLRLLARELNVFVVGEYRTTARCGDCGAPHKHPKKPNPNGNDFKGTVFCSAKDCLSGSAFRNRDTAAARSIALRFVAGKFLGVDLGCFASGASKTAPRISLSAALGVGPHGQTVAGTAA